MRKRLLIGLFASALVSGFTIAQAPSKLKLEYGHDLRVRKADEKDFNEKTGKFGVEVFSDTVGGATLYLTEAGNLTATPASAFSDKKNADWKYASEYRCRKADQDAWKDAPKFGVEVFQDTATGKLIYACESKFITAADAGANIGREGSPKWSHGLLLKVRAQGQAGFKDAKKFGVEVFKDGNTGGLVYICESGALATAAYPGSDPDPTKPKAPKALHGLDLRVRKAGEKDFGKDTKSFAVEVFKDENTGGLIYICETGAIATVPAPKDIKEKQGVVWKHAFELKARKAGEKDFEKAVKFGVEVYQDNNTGYLVYISDTGSIAVVVK